MSEEQKKAAVARLKSKGACCMNWVILVTVTMGDPFVIPYKTFEYENACVEYVNDVDNASTLAIEVIA